MLGNRNIMRRQVKGKRKKKRTSRAEKQVAIIFGSN